MSQPLALANVTVTVHGAAISTERAGLCAPCHHHGLLTVRGSWPWERWLWVLLLLESSWNETATVLVLQFMEPV
jgi:hypothetical protein